MNEKQKLVNLVIRIIFLSLITYSITSYVPTIPLTLEIKLIITILVVITYSTMDFMGEGMIGNRNFICDYVC